MRLGSHHTKEAREKQKRAHLGMRHSEETKVKFRNRNGPANPNYRHGHAATDGASPCYKTWRRMIQRCENAANKDYPEYGARGIAVYIPWHRFEAFLEDMGERPEGTSIDRVDNDGPYAPWNCRWATPKEQAQNRRRRRWRRRA